MQKQEVTKFFDTWGGYSQHGGTLAETAGLKISEVPSTLKML